ncbi:hypothetical protein [Streptomyces sp. NPDC051162]|uniref:hypothetical protein n=1 Tax=Streptomyces sp. NPDC051162 TaxID=3154747 RepID=UPI00342EAFC0
MERTHDEPEPDRTPHENSLFSEPADVEHCRADYENGAADRAAAYDKWSEGSR